MRLKLFVCGVTTLFPVLLLAGCGVNQTSMIVPNVQSAGITGRAMGGQQPVSGATIEVVSMGTSGYGSAGTMLSSTTTDANGNFTLPGYTCPQSDTPVYLLGIGGDAGAGPNPSAMEAVALGGCASAQQSYVIMNEVTTAVTAFVFSHYFSTATPVGSTAGGESIGGPSTTSGTTTTYSRGLTFANNVSMPLLVTYFDGAVNQGNGYTVEWQKINTIANIISACINSSGSPSSTETKTTCGKLFNLTANGATPRPADTLEAAVQMALHPTTNVANLYALIGTTPPFLPFLSSSPNDWTIGVSYTTPSLGLAVDTGTLSTLDIDSLGNIWFPSNAAGMVGAAYFNPSNQSFSGPYNTTSLGHPQQVAIDANSYVWLNDGNSATVSGYLTTSPTLTESVAFPNTTSQSLTIGGDDRVNVGITNGGKYEMANISADRSSYSLASGITFPLPAASMAGDTSDGDAVTIVNTVSTAMRYDYVSAAPALTQVGTANDDSGQVIYTGNDDIAARSYSGSGNANDGLCIYSLATCYAFQTTASHTVQAEGMAIDGGGQLWVAGAAVGGLLEVPVNNPGATGGAVYLNSGGTANIPNKLLLHNGNDGQADTAPMPYGVGVDDAGNVWMTNAGCTTNDCVPGAFTLTEVVGAAYPTITPVSAQITSGNLVGTEPTY